MREIICAVQAALGVTVDGKAGPETWRAIGTRILGAKPDPHPVDERSERAISTLLPEVQPYARALVTQAATAGITIKVICGTRTFEEQEALYAQGRTVPGPIVTHARGGESNHNFGIAFDIGVWEHGAYVPESPAYAAVGALGTGLGLEWGGHWKSIRDEPHFQLRPQWAVGLCQKEMLAELRARHERSRNI